MLYSFQPLHRALASRQKNSDQRTAWFSACSTNLPMASRNSSSVRVSHCRVVKFASRAVCRVGLHSNQMCSTTILSSHPARCSHTCTVRRHFLKPDGDISMSHFSGVAPAGIFVVVSAGEGLGCVAVARRNAVAASAMACVLACVLTCWAAGLAAASACLRLIGVAKRSNPNVVISGSSRVLSAL